MMGNLFKVFGPSPIKPIEQHMKTAYTCVHTLQPFFEAVLQGDWKAALTHQQEIVALEKKADHIKRDLRLHLPTGLFLPFARTDLLELLHAQDKIANKAQDIAGLIMSRKMQIPKAIHALFTPFLSSALHAAHQAAQAINELDELLETGFRGNEVKVVNAMILKLDELEQENDAQLAEIQHEIFMLEKTLPTIDVIFLYKIVRWIAGLADLAQTIGARLQILMAK